MNEIDMNDYKHRDIQVRMWALELVRSDMCAGLRAVEAQILFDWVMSGQKDGQKEGK